MPVDEALAAVREDRQEPVVGLAKMPVTVRDVAEHLSMPEHQARYRLEALAAAKALRKFKVPGLGREHFYCAADLPVDEALAAVRVRRVPDQEQIVGLAKMPVTVRDVAEHLSMPEHQARYRLEALAAAKVLRKFKVPGLGREHFYCAADLPAGEALAAVREDRQEPVVGLAKTPVTVRDVAEHLSIGKGHARYRLEALAAAKALRKFKVPGLRREHFYCAAGVPADEALEAVRVRRVPNQEQIVGLAKTPVTVRDVAEHLSMPEHQARYRLEALAAAKALRKFKVPGLGREHFYCAAGVPVDEALAAVREDRVPDQEQIVGLAKMPVTVRDVAEHLSIGKGHARYRLEALAAAKALRKFKVPGLGREHFYCAADLPVDEALAAVREDRQEPVVGLAKMPVTVRDVAEHLSIGKGHARYRLEALAAAKALRKFKVPGLRREHFYCAADLPADEALEAVRVRRVPDQEQIVGLAKTPVTVRDVAEHLSMPEHQARYRLEALAAAKVLRKFKVPGLGREHFYCAAGVPADEALEAVRVRRVPDQEHIVGLAKMPVTVRDVAEHLSIGKGHAWYRLEALVAAKVLRKFKVPGLRRKFLYYSTENTPR